MSRDPLPEPWRTELERKGISSKRGLASRVGISPQTAKRLIDGEGQPSAETVAAVADELFGGDRTKVWKLAGHRRQDHGEWSLPPEASQLDPEQRKAVLAVVRAMLPPEVRRRGDDGGDAAPMTLPRAARRPGVTTAEERRRAVEAAREAGSLVTPDDLDHSGEGSA